MNALLSYGKHVEAQKEGIKHRPPGDASTNSYAIFRQALKVIVACKRHHVGHSSAWINARFFNFFMENCAHTGIRPHIYVFVQANRNKRNAVGGWCWF
jgi:hypothetical protein